MVTKKFLESYPLLKKYSVIFDTLTYTNYVQKGSIGHLKKISINMSCNICGNTQTFNMENDYEHYSVERKLLSSPIGKIFELRYLCASCNGCRHTFFVEFGTDRKSKKGIKTFKGWVRKIGQHPSWEITIKKNLKKALEKDSGLYKKGLVCESQSYGIGAYAYYRRVTENVIDALLSSITGLLDDDEKEKYEKALEKVKETRVAEKKIKLVKNLIPSSLQPGGINPLQVLYSALSKGIHKSSDEECLQIADAIKNTLTYLLEEIRRRSKETFVFTKGMRTLLDDK